MTMLTDALFPKDSPIATNQGQVSSYQFDYENESNIISSAKIRNAAITNAQIGTAAIGTANIGTLSFNEIHGGTATFGGSGNGNGLVLVKDAGGTTHVQLDNTGLTVTNGSVTLNNASGSTSFDSSGVVSVNNFSNAYGQAGGGLNQQISGTAYVPLTGGTVTAILARTVYLFSTINIGWYHIGTANDYANFALFVNGTNTYEVVIGNKYTDLISSSRQAVLTLSSGTTTLILKVAGPTTGTVNVYDFLSSFVLLGT